MLIVINTSKYFQIFPELQVTAIMPGWIPQYCLQNSSKLLTIAHTTHANDALVLLGGAVPLVYQVFFAIVWVEGRGISQFTINNLTYQ